MDGTGLGGHGAGTEVNVSRRWLLSGVAAGGAALAACAGPGGDGAGGAGGGASSARGPVTVQILDRNPGDALIPDYDRIFQRFTQAHPAITVERLDTGGQDRDRKFQVLAAAGQPADVDWMDQANVGPFREQGLLRALDPYLKRDRYSLDDFYAQAQKIYQYRGQTYGVLHTTSPRIYVYNKTLFQQKGVPLPDENWTWDQLRDALVRLTGAGGEGASYGGTMGRNLELAGFVYQNGGKVVDDLFAPARALLDTREALEGVQFLVDLDVKLGVSVGDASKTGGLTAAQLWTQGRLGINHTSIWSHKVWARDLPFEWDQVVPSRNRARASMLSSSGHVVAQLSRHPDEAWALVQELNGREAMSALAATGGLMLGRKSVSNSDAFLKAVPKPANMKAFAQAMEYAYPTRLCNGLSVDFYDLTVNQMAPVWAGTQSVPAAMAEVVRQANAMFAEYAARTKQK
ncbi:MAG TPA: sugar ABC transporter substrate-binding protein [Chloroflexota bacterium]|nr:sugar ABC transporter substrate-binding protein [Chloroflexota bacterium]